MFLVFCLIIWVVDQYQGGLGLPVQENVDQLADLLKSNILMVCIDMSSYDFLHFEFFVKFLLSSFSNLFKPGVQMVHNCLSRSNPEAANMLQALVMPKEKKD